MSDVSGGVSVGNWSEKSLSSNVSDVGWHFHESKRDDWVITSMHLSDVGGGVSVGNWVELSLGRKGIDVGIKVLEVGVGAHFVKFLILNYNYQHPILVKY